ncbi:DUF3120 domain-containing protein [Oxynema sp. CENA135]|uniref:DUF3120 domain-containing protein n=1 Tax=Oxynema sp. CENA135 TaxID=984206 RepID=UPI00351C130E
MAQSVKSAIDLLKTRVAQLPIAERQWMFGAAVFLVTVPVFFEAPLVRYAPLCACLITGGWWAISWGLLSRRETEVWGDLLLGFTGTWLTGSVYWGGLRWEPLLHLPVEALGLPIALWCLWRARMAVGTWFYLGSLLGTAVTDLYFYIVDLIPHWRQLMHGEPELAGVILSAALERVNSPTGTAWAIALALVLLATGAIPLRSRHLHWWAFGGAVLSTILVDGLFWLAAWAGRA